MLQEFINFYLEKANYKLIDNGKTYYAEIPALKGIWATGKNLEECRRNLLETLEGWVILRLKKNLSIPNFQIPFAKMRVERAYA